MARQLQDPQDPHYPKDLHYPPHVLELLRRALVRFRQPQGDEVGHDCQEVDDVQRALEKLPLVGRGPEAREVLEGEPADANGLHHGQFFIVPSVGGVCMVLQVGDGVERQGDGGEDDEENGDDSKYLEHRHHHATSRGPVWYVRETSLRLGALATSLRSHHVSEGATSGRRLRAIRCAGQQIMGVLIFYIKPTFLSLSLLGFY